MGLSKQALELVKRLASETPITVTGNTINEVQKLLQEVLGWCDTELLPKDKKEDGQ